jgi:hypothetical protein
MSVLRRATAGAVAVGLTAAAGLALAPAAGAMARSHPSFIGQFHKLTTIASTSTRTGPWRSAVARASCAGATC